MDDWREIEEGPSLKWTPYYKNLNMNITEHGDDILSVAPGEGLFLFVHDNMLKSDAVPIEETFSIELNSSKEDLLKFMHYTSVLRMHPSMKNSSNDNIVNLVDKYITCQNDKSSEIEDSESTAIAQRVLQ